MMSFSLLPVLHLLSIPAWPQCWELLVQKAKFFSSHFQRLRVTLWL